MGGEGGGNGGNAAAAPIRFAVLLLSAFCVLFGVRGLVASFYASRPPGAERMVGLSTASKVTPENWRYRLEQAEFLASLGELAAAEAEYRGALKTYPACAQCWIGLAEVESALGRDPTRSIDNASKFGRSTTSIRMRAATLFARLNLDDRAASEFSAVLRGNWDARRPFYELMHRLYGVEFLLDHVIVSTQLPLYAYYSFAERPLEEARSVWTRLDDTHYLRENPSLKTSYARRLLKAGLVNEAWQSQFRDGEDAPIGALVDGGFEDGAEQPVFGWHFRKVDGVRAERRSCKDCPEGSYGLRFVFDGKHNPDYRGVWQDVPVLAGKTYVLNAFVKYHEITSPNGPRFEIRGLGAPARPTGQRACALFASSKDWRLSEPWAPVSVEFFVPEGCDGIRLMVTRKSATQLNRFFSGELWIDDVRLSEVPANSGIAAAEEISPAAAPGSLGGTLSLDDLTIRVLGDLPTE